MICAGVDIGTNTALMVIAERYADDTYTVIHDLHEVPRLGEGLDSSGEIAKDALHRAVESLDRFKSALSDAGVVAARAVATSAMREAKNSTHVRQVLEAALGLPIEVISGDTEARLSFLGSVGRTSERTTMIDIGGGSTEYASGAGGIVTFAASTSIGAVRFTERYATTRPVTSGSLVDARNSVSEALEPILEKYIGSDRLVGVAGTPTALAMIDLGLSSYDADLLDGHSMQYRRVLELTEWLFSCTLEEVRAIPGIHERRADIVPMGALILTESMRLLQCTSVKTSVRGLRFGAMLTSTVTGV
ncbi:MAG: hypothetical protein NTX15_03490 [Candidatus Kapabacteria bacterium]|nr:hypothetical protein [Candidatus Kapabacteria bacterium]